MLNIIDKKLFKQIFDHTIETLANKLINTTKEENQIIVNDIKKMKINFTKKMMIINMRYNQAINILI